MSLTADLMELPEAAVTKHYGAAEAMLAHVDHAPRLAKGDDAPAAPERSAGIGTRRRFRSTTPGLVTRPTTRVGAASGGAGVSLIERIEGEGAFPSPKRASLLAALRRALAIALAVGEAYAERTGLAEMRRANLGGGLAEDRKEELNQLVAAEAAASLHVFANALAFLAAPLATETSVEVAEPEEILTDNAVLALHGALWEIDKALAPHDEDDRLVAALLAHAELLMDKVAARAAHMARLEPFTSAAWRVESDDLTIRGFTPARRGRGKALSMTFKKPHEVVGNHIAKYQAMKLAKMLMAYDFDRKLNPFAEMGGFIFTFMGDGAPGTGKTTLIQMMAGLVNEYCGVAGYPFRYRNLSTDSIDSYQGKSAQNARAFIDEIVDPNVIGFGTIDDIDQLAGKRGDRQSSAGQLEITAVLMDAFAGANTVVRGNCTFGMFSNYPENVDDALRQRAGARFLVDGPQTREDYVDILALLLGKNHDIPVGDHDLFAAQAIEKAVSESYASHDRPKEAGLIRVYEDVRGQVGEFDSLNEVGTYLKAIQEADARFTGRAIKNITDAVKVRSMDVELPDEWMEDPELFMHRDYETKKSMIEGLRVPITMRMLIQEINRYADSEFRYSGKSDEVAVEGMVRQMGLQEEAARRYRERSR